MGFLFVSQEDCVPGDSRRNLKKLLKVISVGAMVSSFNLLWPGVVAMADDFLRGGANGPALTFAVAAVFDQNNKFNNSCMALRISATTTMFQ